MLAGDRPARRAVVAMGAAIQALSTGLRQGQLEGQPLTVGSTGWADTGRRGPLRIATGRFREAVGSTALKDTAGALKKLLNAAVSAQMRGCGRGQPVADDSHRVEIRDGSATLNPRQLRDIPGLAGCCATEPR